MGIISLGLLALDGVLIILNRSRPKLQLNSMTFGN